MNKINYQISVSVAFFFFGTVNGGSKEILLHDTIFCGCSLRF